VHGRSRAVVLGPAYGDAFDFGEGRVIRFTRDHTGKVDGLEISPAGCDTSGSCAS
jgi:hypothetical protein